MQHLLFMLITLLSVKLYYKYILALAVALEVAQAVAIFMMNTAEVSSIREKLNTFWTKVSLSNIIFWITTAFSYSTGDNWCKFDNNPSGQTKIRCLF